jgi:hypothetical protein
MHENKTSVLLLQDIVITSNSLCDDFAPNKASSNKQPLIKKRKQFTINFLSQW